MIKKLDAQVGIYQRNNVHNVQDLASSIHTRNDCAGRVRRGRRGVSGNVGARLVLEDLSKKNF